MPSLAQISFEEACMKNEMRYVQQHLWRYEYDCKCNRYSPVTTTVSVKQLHVTSLKGFCFWCVRPCALAYTVRKQCCQLFLQQIYQT